MKNSDIRGLYDLIYDTVFAGEFEQPKLHILDNIFLGGLAWFNSMGGCEGAEILICKDGHENIADVTESIIHEYCHAVQSVKGERLSHGKKFKQYFQDATQKFVEYCNG